VVAAAERSAVVHRKGGALNVRQLADMSQRRQPESGVSRRAVSLGQRAAHDPQVALVHARVLGKEPAEAVEQETSADEEYERRCRLECDQAALNAGTPVAQRRATSAFAQAVLHILETVYTRIGRHQEGKNQQHADRARGESRGVND
jgi:hypothetical protein